MLALRPSGKFLSTELWILLASWHVALRNCVASTIRTYLLTTCALALAPVCSGVPLVCVDLPPSLQLTSNHLCVPSPMALRLRLRVEARGVDSAIATLDKKACEGSALGLGLGLGLGLDKEAGGLRYNHAGQRSSKA